VRVSYLCFARPAVAAQVDVDLPGVPAPALSPRRLGLATVGATGFEPV